MRGTETTTAITFVFVDNKGFILRKTELSDAIAEANEIAKSLHGLVLTGGLRSRAGLACLAIAQQHQSAMLILLNNTPPLVATAFALLRPLLEVTLRGEWVLHCASDDQIRSFVEKDKGNLGIPSLMKSLEKHLQRTDIHELLYEKYWSKLSSYTHTYSHQVLHWLASKDVESKYTPEEISFLISSSASLLRLIDASVRSLVVK